MAVQSHAKFMKSAEKLALFELFGRHVKLTILQNQQMKELYKNR